MGGAYILVGETDKHNKPVYTMVDDKCSRRMRASKRAWEGHGEGRSVGDCRFKWD